jgi:hypothetical protein
MVRRVQTKKLEVIPAYQEVLHNYHDDCSWRARKPLNPNRLKEYRDLKEGFALHCSGPPANH